jgi:hypothetical protein
MRIDSAFETLAQAIANKDPHDVMAIIAFESDAVTGEPRPSDLFHDEIERLRASAELKAYLPEITPAEAEDFIKKSGRVAAVVVHDDGLVRANPIYGDFSQLARVQDEVDEILQAIQRQYRVVKKRAG